MERFANWSELPAKKQEVLERKLFYGKEMMMVRNEVKPHGVLALHSHPHAQMTMVLAGACDVTMKGETFHLTTDGVVYFPPDVPEYKRKRQNTVHRSIPGSSAQSHKQ